MLLSRFDVVRDFRPRRTVAVKPRDGAVSTRRLAAMSFAEPNGPRGPVRVSKTHGCKTPDPRTAVKAAQRPRSGLGLDGEHGSGPSAAKIGKHGEAACPPPHFPPSPSSS
jgi:hypothetical protein